MSTTTDRRYVCQLGHNEQINQVFLASDNPLPLTPPDQSFLFRAQPLLTESEPVLRLFSKPHVYDLSSVGGCACGFGYSPYDLEVLDDAGGVVRTVSDLPSPSWTYPAAQQAADFGATRYAYTVNVYQLSVLYGRGQVARRTVI